MNLLPSILMSLIVAAGTAVGMEMEYISPEQKDQIAADFEKAKLEKADEVLDRKWSCDMFGVRSRLQVQRGVNLYSLRSAMDGEILNKGAQVVAKYQPKDGALLGRTDRFEDEIRMTSSGQLISRLSGRQAGVGVIAYSICKAL